MSARYRKLPGHRRGFLKSYSVWMGADHLLSVRNMRFREEYKRFHLRDIQAIAVAGAPRFHISTRDAAIAILYSAGAPIAGKYVPGAAPFLWAGAVVLALAWIYVSSYCSCRCRIYTQVSSDELPSIYRTWTARRFLARVEPAIGQIQGQLGPAWAEAIEDRAVGPANALPLAPGVTPAAVRPAMRTRTPATDLFILSVLGGGIAGLLTLYSRPSWFYWLDVALLIAQLAGTVVIIAQRYRGVLNGRMQVVAIVNLVLVGAGYYAGQFIQSIRAANQHLVATVSQPLFAGSPTLRAIQSGAALLLGLTGLALSLMREEPAVDVRSNL